MKIRPVIIILSLFIFYLPFQGYFSYSIGGSTIMNQTNVFMMVLSFMYFGELVSGNQSKTVTSLRPAILIFILIELLSFIVYGAIGDNAIYYVTYFKRNVFTLLTVFIVLRCVRTEDEIKVLFFIILLTAAITGLDVLRATIYLPGGYNRNFADGARVVGPFGGGKGSNGANEAAAFLVQYGSLLLAYYLFMPAKSFLRRSALCGFLICLYPLVFTYSRGGYIAAILSIIFITFMKSKKSLVVVLIILSTFPMWAPPSVMQRIEMTTIEDEDGSGVQLERSADKRTMAWSGAMEMIKKNPMGVGMKNFQREIVKYVPANIGKMDAHNNYVLIGAELGIIGLLVFIVILICIYKSTWGLYGNAKKINDDFYKAFSIGFVGSLISMTVVNMFGSHFFDDKVNGIMWILTSLIVKSQAITSNKIHQEVLPDVRNLRNT